MRFLANLMILIMAATLFAADTQQPTTEEQKAEPEQELPAAQEEAAPTKEADNEAAPEETSQSTTASEEPTLEVARAVICTAIVQREPLGASETFSTNTEKLYCFTHIMGAKGEVQIEHKWYFNNELKATVPLTVKSSNWRTRSSKRLSPDWIGDWKVEVVDVGSQTVLRVVGFKVE